MGWVAIVVLALLVGLLLWRFGGMPRAALEPVAAALLLGLAGYALQGSPTQPANEVAARPEKPDIDEDAILQRNAMGERFSGEAGWMVAADGAMRAGLTRSAVTYIRSGLRENPDSADLWVGMGNALINHADGLITPPAQYAFGQAARISPEHPGPPFFLGLALAQSGQIDQARTIWQQLLERTPENAPWRADLQMRLSEIEGAAGG